MKMKYSGAAHLKQDRSECGVFPLDLHMASATENVS